MSKNRVSWNDELVVPKIDRRIRGADGNRGKMAEDDTRGIRSRRRSDRGLGSAAAADDDDDDNNNNNNSVIHVALLLMLMLMLIALLQSMEEGMTSIPRIIMLYQQATKEGSDGGIL
jgi:hypothetical protein